MSKDSSLTLHYNGFHLGFLSCSQVFGKATVLINDKHSSLYCQNVKEEEEEEEEEIVITFCEGATTFSITTLSITTFSITIHKFVTLSIVA